MTRADGCIESDRSPMWKRGAIGALASLLFLTPRAARAEETRAEGDWTARKLTLSQGSFGVDAGLGVGTNAPVTGVGAFLGLHYAITDRVEVTIRDGARFNNDAIHARADQYGHLYLTDGLATAGIGTFASPELTAAGRLFQWRFLELGAEARISVPVEPHLYTGATLGLPVALHRAPWIRVDTGVFVSATFQDSMQRTYLLPVAVWFQPGWGMPVWFGPISAVRYIETGSTFQVPLGFGAGYALSPDVDIRGEILVPQIVDNPGLNFVGGGLGVQVRH